MSNKATITYIKNNGEEKTITINFANKNKVLNSLFQINKSNNYTYYKLREDIDKITFKNFLFPHDNLILYCERELSPSIYLENCTFNNRVDLTFKHLKIKNLNFNSNKENYIEIGTCLNADIDLSNTKEEVSLSVTSCLDLKLITGNNLKKTYISSVYTYIENLTPQNNPNLHISSKLTLVNSTYTINFLTNLITDSLTLINSEISSENSLILDFKNLSLENSSLKAEDSIYLNTLSKIEFNDIIDNTILDTSSYLEAGNQICIANTIYQNDKKERLILTKAILEKQLELEKLISILKTLHNHLTTTQDNQIKLIEEQLLRKINKEEEIIKKQVEKYINQKYDELNKKLEKINNTASKTKVRELVLKK